MVMNVQVERLSATSMRVSWEMINNTEITNYTVYFRAICYRERQDVEWSITVPSAVNSVGIRNSMIYHFQVAAVVKGGSSFSFTGQRSDAVSPASPPSPGEYILTAGAGDIGSGMSLSKPQSKKKNYVLL